LTCQPVSTHIKRIFLDVACLLAAGPIIGQKQSRYKTKESLTSTKSEGERSSTSNARTFYLFFLFMLGSSSDVGLACAWRVFVRIGWKQLFITINCHGPSRLHGHYYSGFSTPTDVLTGECVCDPGNPGPCTRAADC